MADRSAWSGVINVNKPEGWTSGRAVTCFRHELGGDNPRRAKIGHAGTLDPMASGVLVLVVGHATRLAEIIMNAGKEYVAAVQLGAISSTDDREGAITWNDPPRSPPDELRVRDVLAEFLGDISQRPPAHSAIKLGGKRAYQWARRGRELDIPPRPVHVEKIDLIEYRWPVLRVRVACGRGTYVRSLARDIGRQLGVGGYLSALQRARVGPFSVEDAVDPRLCRYGDRDRWLLPVERALPGLPRVDLDESEAEMLSRTLPLELHREGFAGLRRRLMDLGVADVSAPSTRGQGGAIASQLFAAYDPSGAAVAVCRVSWGKLIPAYMLRPRAQ